MAISKANRGLFRQDLFPKVPGSSFAQYVQQEQNKFEKSEAEVTAKHIVDCLKESIRDALGGSDFDYRYCGKLDGRLHLNYPGPAKEGSFWVIEGEGTVGSKLVIPGDILVRKTSFQSDWRLIGVEQVHPEVEKLISHPHLKINASNVVAKMQLLEEAYEKGFTKSELEEAMGITKSHLQQLKDGLAKQARKPGPVTKAAPGVAKRKIILEDD